MKVKTYRAATTRMVLQQIRQELGPDALILNKREVRRGKLLGLLQKGYVEVTAGVDYSELPLGNSAAPQQDAGEIAERSESQFLREEIGKLKAMIESISSNQHGNTIWLRPGRFSNPDCKRMYTDLVARGIADSLAHDLVAGASESPADLRKNVGAVLTSRLRIHPDLAAAGPDRKPAVVALLGPTGVGKTTTLAKIAARAALQARLKVGLVTLDTFRIAAIQQLKTYGEIMGIPLRVADSVSEMGDAIKAFAGRDLILIDTAGRSQHERSSRCELAEFMYASADITKALVLSATTRANDLQSIVDGYDDHGTNCLIFTKLDETDLYGTVIQELIRTQKPLAYVTTGQRVPQDILRPDASGIVELALGRGDSQTWELFVARAHQAGSLPIGGFAGAAG